MEDNKRIKELLNNKRGDLKEFSGFIKMTPAGVNYKLKSQTPSDNLWGMYEKFVVFQKDNIKKK